MHVWFEHLGGALKSRDGGALTWFTISGSGRTFVAAGLLRAGGRNYNELRSVPAHARRQRLP